MTSPYDWNDMDQKNKILGVVIRLGSMIKQPSKEEHVCPESYVKRYTLDELAIIEKHNLMPPDQIRDLRRQALEWNTEVETAIKQVQYLTIGAVTFLHKLANNNHNRYIATICHDLYMKVHIKRKIALAKFDQIMLKADVPQIPLPDPLKTSLCMTCEINENGVILYPCRHSYQCDYCFNKYETNCRICASKVHTFVLKCQLE
jgi:hypothetical protein